MCKTWKVSEFNIGQGKVEEIVACLLCAVAVEIVTNSPVSRRISRRPKKISS